MKNVKVIQISDSTNNVILIVFRFNISKILPLFY